jgi:SAM-dependent methyltransferase/LmbE family N-acetylglucosaminyl deacetylase
MTSTSATGNGNKAVARVDNLSPAAGAHVFFSPHADDVVLSCGGAIHSLNSAGKDIRIVGVFAGVSEQQYSAFARHLHSKWRLSTDPVAQRWREDTVAMRELGISNFVRWDFLEAPYRLGADGVPLYLANEDLIGEPVSEDKAIRLQLAESLKTYLAQCPRTSVLYFPMALGHHVDHQIVHDLGRELSDAGWSVLFYEDYPYAQNYKLAGDELHWRPQTMAIQLATKLRAACAYTSQLHGLGGSAAVLERRLLAYGTSVNGGALAERYWQIGPHSSASRSPAEGQPLVRKETDWRLRDLRRVFETFRWHDLDEVLPSGTGNCVDVGCGNARHRALTEARGYRWLGVDRHDKRKATLCADGASLPLGDKTVAGVIAWQLLEYAERPEQVVAEAARVLEPGGVFCGSVSFLEPVHGQTYFNISPLILRRLLERYGFSDIELMPGINGLALIFWTWLSRSAIPFAPKLALPLALALTAPLAIVMFFLSWTNWRFSKGSGHTMRWLAETAPLEFAGHVMFTARRTTHGSHGPDLTAVAE